MRVAIEDDGSYVLDQSIAIGELLREHGLENANSMRAPIGSDSYEVQPEDCALLSDSADGECPSIRTF